MIQMSYHHRYLMILLVVMDFDQCLGLNLFFYWSLIITMVAQRFDFSFIK